jgi:hypothetical protein
VTEITMTGGERLRVQGEPAQVERLILAAARGSLMELAWVEEAETGERVGINPEHVMLIRGVET